MHPACQDYWLFVRAHYTAKGSHMCAPAPQPSTCCTGTSGRTANRNHYNAAIHTKPPRHTTTKKGLQPMSISIQLRRCKLGDPLYHDEQVTNSPKSSAQSIAGRAINFHLTHQLGMPSSPCDMPLLAACWCATSAGPVDYAVAITTAAAAASALHTGLCCFHAAADSPAHSSAQCGTPHKCSCGPTPAAPLWGH